MGCESLQTSLVLRTESGSESQRGWETPPTRRVCVWQMSVAGALSVLLLTGAMLKDCWVQTGSPASEVSLSQPDSPTDASTSTLTGESGLPGFSEWRLPGEGERPSRSRRSSRILDAITSPPRPGSKPRRSIPRRMSSLEERPQVLHNPRSHFVCYALL